MHLLGEIWALKRENLTLLHANNKVQTILHILISAFVIHFLESAITLHLQHAKFFNILAGPCSKVSWFGPFMDTKPEDRFFGDEAHLV